MDERYAISASRDANKFSNDVDSHIAAKLTTQHKSSCKIAKGKIGIEKQKLL